MRIGESDMRARIVRIACECLLEILDGTTERRGRPQVRCLTSAQAELVCLEVLRRTCDERHRCVLDAERHLKLIDDASRDLVLNGEDVVEIAIESLAPELKAIVRIHELDGDTHPI